MLSRGAGARAGLRWGAVSLVAAITVLAVSSEGSDARSRRRHPQPAEASRPAEAASEEPRYSDIVVDGNSGAILHASSPDALRHPASLTKVMTLYLLFEQLEAGKFKLDSALDVSEHAAVQSPTKLGLREGQTIKVEDAIKGIVTRSANDAAVVVAENVGGDEESFARLMTRKAQSLGMAHTIYRNASGLPNDEQVTTARDQALLGRAIQERFPRYYKYFSTRSFEFHGEEIGNHNRLLGSVEGVDGIKTGYVAASGFNLLTSVHRDNRYLVAVVFGGSSASSRDERMRELIRDNITEASVQHTASMIAEAAPKADAKPEAAVDTKPVMVTSTKPSAKLAAKAGAKPAPTFALASTESVQVTLSSKSDPGATTVVQVPRWAATNTAPAAHPMPTIGSEDPIRPVPVKTVMVHAGNAAQTASLASVGVVAAEPAAQPPAPAVAPTTPSPAKAVALPFPPPVTRANSVTETVPAAAVAAAPVAPPPAVAPTPAAAPHQSAPQAEQQSAPSVAPAAPQPPAHVGWMIQVGAFPAEDEAKQRLSSVQTRASRYLASADPFTETVNKGDAVLYRARFAGLAKEQAEAACNYLKHNDVDCMTIKN